MISGIVGLILFIMLGFSGSVSLAADRAPVIPVEAFARLPEISTIKISPDGEYFAVLMALGGQNRLVIQKIENSEGEKPYLAKVGDTKLLWFEWVNNERLILAVSFEAERYGVPTTETRLIGLNRDGSQPKQLGPKVRDYDNPSQLQDNVIDMLYSDRDHVLISVPDDSGRYPAVFRLNVYNNKMKRVVSSRPDTWNWVTDHDSNVRLGIGLRSKRRLLWVRDSVESKWRVLDLRESFAGSVFRPLGFSVDPNILYVRSDHERERAAIYEYDLTTGDFKRRVFADDRVDIVGIIQSKRSNKLLRSGYVDDNGYVHIVNDDAIAEQAWLDEKLPDTRNRIISETPDERRAIIRATNVKYPGKFYLLDRPSKGLYLVGQRYPDLDPTLLVDMQAVSYQARDNLTIHGYLSLPKSAQTDNFPLVVLPHGGPTTRDTLGFDYWVQFMASRGYAVFQPNFRGSSGYGMKFQAAGNKQWGLAMQDDITDGVKWLIETGVADAKRICIVGGSYGGYAALMGVVKTPDLYRCAVSLAGVTDLPSLLFQESAYVGSALNAETIGRSLLDRSQLLATSPAQQAKRITAAVLIVHGLDDRVVSIKQARKMRKALKRARVRHEYVELEDGDHHLSLGKNRLIFLQKLEAFLARHLGPNTVAGK